MIFIKLSGGLGNQMFQFAFGLALAKKHKQPLYVDLSFLLNRKLEGVTFRDYELKVFEGNPKVINKSIPAFLEVFSSVCNRVQVKQPLYKKLDESTFSSTSELSPFINHVVGYWQSERYFIEAENEIRKAFSFAIAPSVENQQVLKQISETISVSVHVRRGDYVSSPKNLAYHGVCGLDYYERAIAYVQQKIPEACFYVFSDDPSWVQSHLSFGGATVHFVTHNSGANSYEDLRLMQHCQHHIIANSSFSWWGAWLNKRPDKLVIAPSRWFVDTKANEKADHIIPESWLKI